ncbi:MAG: cytochrome c oxidase subunit 3 [Acidobacteria bacterium]|jgi:cytochrome c oxidase subunit 3|nr:cytochrome c oxidase subunit 3 [Acidobacteriota bacterium]
MNRDIVLKSDETKYDTDYTHARISMWLFLVTEIFTAWGFFLIYSVYKAQFKEDFQFAGSTLDILPGFLISIILITGCLTITLTSIYLERENRDLSSLFLFISVCLGTFFLIIKFFEWSVKIKKGLFPKSQILQTHPPGENVFYNLYYMVTGFHGVLVLAATVSLAVLLFYLRRKSIPDKNLLIKLENTALLWHTLVILWIFLFPLFYLLS